MFDLIVNSFKTLFRKRGRTTLTLIGIAVGVASVIIINNIGNCGNEALTGEINGLGIGGISVSLKKQSASLSKNELETIEALTYVDYAMPLVFESTDAYMRDTKTPVYLWGIDKSAKDIIALQLLEGRFINTTDISSASKICMIDSSLAEKTYGTLNVTGKKIFINSGGTSGEYTVIGVLKTGSGILQNIMGSYIPDFIYIPYSTMQNNLSSSNFTQIAVKLKDGYDNEVSGNNIVKAIERKTNSGGAYTFTNLAQQKENISNILNIFTLVLSAIGMISLFVAGLSIMNVMLVSVNERTREIGIKKALGASRGIIVFEFLCESAVLTLLGGITGIVFGTAVSMAGVGIIGLTFSPRVDIIIETLVFCIVVGIIFGIYPAVKAARLRPVEALRTF